MTPDKLTFGEQMVGWGFISFAVLVLWLIKLVIDNITNDRGGGPGMYT